MNKQEKKKTVASAYFQSRRRQRRLAAVFFVLLLAAVIIAVFLGSNDVTFKNALVTAFPDAFKWLNAEPMTQVQQGIILKLRVPRVVCAIVVGAALSMCGTVMQATTGNVMASPYTTGISSAAALGAAIGILFQPFGPGNFSTIAMAFIVALTDAALVYGVTAICNLGAGGMILIGVALNFLFGAGNSLLQYIASSDQLSQIVHWTFGSLTGVGWTQIIIIAVATVLCMILFMRNAWSFNILSSGGDESAISLGINPNRVRVICGLAVTLMAAILISFIGVVGFVGLVAPHIARIIFGTEHSTLIPVSALLGSLLVLIADTIGRILIAPSIIPVGIVLSVTGAPLFVYLIIMQNRRKLY